MSDYLPTVKLYDEDAYRTEFSATVLSCREVTEDKSGRNGLYAVILDRTVFFPEEGGQTPDTGRLGGIDVADVQIKGGLITHYLKAPIEEGSEVLGEIDFAHRFSNMQQHTGEHIFSGIVHERYGYENVGFHLSDNVVTFDFNGVLSFEQISEIEREVNSAIYKNVEVKAYYPSKEELAALNYRSKKELSGDVRIVEIPGYDRCACCAPHVHRTGEIGMLKVMSLQNYKGGVRVSVLCGYRALAAFSAKIGTVSTLMNELTTAEDRLDEAVIRIRQENYALRQELSALRLESLMNKASQIPAEQKNVLLFAEGLDGDTMRNAVNELVKAHEGVCGVFSGADEQGYNFVIGSRSADCRETAKLMREKLSAKGGGSAAMIQGSVVRTRAEIMQILDIA